MGFLLMIGIAIAGLGLLSGVLVFWKVPVIQHSGMATSSVSIIIPARNEEKRLRPLLESITRQQGVAYEIIVVDDDSADGTVRLAKTFGAQVLSNKELAEGWIGKSAACWSGAKAAENELLLFMDADTVFTNPDSLAAYITAFESMGSRGILSLQPVHCAEKWYEHLALLFPLMVMAGMNVFTVLGDRVKTGGAFGPCLLCDRQQYAGVGGHAAVRGAVMDDLALGQEFQTHGLPVHCYGGKGIAWLRMYPEGLSSMIQGYAKSMAAGSAATHPGIMLLIYMWMAGGLLTPVLLLISMGMDGFAIGIPVGLYLAYAIELAIASRRVGQFTDWIFPIYPVLLVVFIATFLYSVYLSKRRKSVQWKGRNIDV